MLGFFTDPYPDEILYSVCARYHRRARNGSAAATVRDLFGCEALQIGVDLPSRLGHLVERMPPGHRYTVNRLIDEHTLLPFYAPFHPPERTQKLRSDMAGAPEGGSIHGRVGFLTSNIFQEFLRFCPACVEEDERLYGKAYWHRVHQVPGVMVCPSHKVFIEDSDIRMSKRGKKDAPVTAKQAVKPVQIRHLETENRDHVAHLRIARDAAWLLRQREVPSGLGVLRKRYLALLCRRSLASYAGIIHFSELKAQFQEYYSGELLDMLSSNLRKRHCWLGAMVQTVRRARHPIRHLLLMHFLGLLVEEFFKLPAEYAPFGEPPFPCLNPAAEHYGEERIVRYEVRYKIQGNREPAGTFWCECGFIYRRFGRDEEGENRSTVNRIIAFGPVWENELRRMYHESGGDLKAMARHLGVSAHVVTKQARRLGLLQSDQRTELAHIRRPKEPLATAAAKRSRHRTLWLQTVRAHPAAGRDDLRRKVPSAYNWLIRNDRQWYEKQSPSLRKPAGPSPFVDWHRRDDEIAAKVRPVAERLRNIPGRPVRVSKQAVMRELRVGALVSKNGSRVPKTISVLNEVTESAEEYAIRRIWWAAGSFLQEKMRASQWKLIKRAAIGRDIQARSSVRDALEAAVEMLEAAAARGWEMAG